MDLWDLTKLLVRRWLIVLPMLAITVALVALTFSQVKPDYVATAYVQLVPPVLAPNKPGQATADQRNPWLGLGLQTIGNAAIVQVMDQSVVKELEATGYSDSFTLTMGQSTPLITFEIIGDSPQQARDTAEQLVERFTKNVTTLQSAYGVSSADSITARRLDLGTNVEKSDSKLKRALVAVAGAGLLMTAAVTVGIDAWLRRRRLRREEAVPTLTPAPVSGRALPSPDATAVLRRHRPSGGDRTEMDAVTTAVPAGNAPMAGTVNGRDGGLTGVNPEQTQVIGRQSTGSTGTADWDREAESPVPSDATVVLPLPLPLPEKSRWLGRSREKKQGT